MIDPGEGLLWFSYLDHKGEMGEKKINIRQAEYYYKRRASNLYPRYELTIKERKAKMKIRETPSQNKNQTNVFFRSHLDEMNQIILDIRSEK